MNLNIREGEKSDFFKLQILFKQLDEKHHLGLPTYFRSSEDINRPESLYESFLESSAVQFLVACTEDSIVGYIHAEIRSVDHPLIIKHDYGHISDVVVDSKWKRKGIAKKLLTEMDIWFKEKDVTEVSLTVFDFNEEALSFYKDMGYTNKHITMFRVVNSHGNT